MTDLELTSFAKHAQAMGFRTLLKGVPELGNWFRMLQGLKRFALRPMPAATAKPTGGMFMSTIFPAAIMGMSAKSSAGEISKGVGGIGPARNIPYTGPMAPLYYK